MRASLAFRWHSLICANATPARGCTGAAAAAGSGAEIVGAVAAGSGADAAGPEPAGAAGASANAAGGDGLPSVAFGPPVGAAAFDAPQPMRASSCAPAEELTDVSGVVVITADRCGVGQEGCWL